MALPFESQVARRWPKTDPLILERLLSEAAKQERFKPELTADPVGDAHKVLIQWADLEASGKLKKRKETQLQGEFLAQVFGKALGYASPADGADEWQLIQHEMVGPETPDAVLGFFRLDDETDLRAVVELKGPKIDLDRDRSQGRTAVDQCWDYLVNTAPTCRWGIVSNMVSFRLYERDSTKRCYEHFSLQQLRDPLVFKRFYALFHRKCLIQGEGKQKPLAQQLLEQTRNRQRDVSDELYEAYSDNRLRLIQQLHFDEGRPLDEAVEMAQRLFDRVMFIAFCEDRSLLPRKTLAKACKVEGFQAVTNPRWQNFKTLFRLVDKGGPSYDIQGYNGGLFAPHAVDDLELADDPYTTFFETVGGYDFRDEVNLDVLGHLFERSITELEKIKASALFGGNAEKASEFASMPQSAKRKRLGVYYTPPELTGRIVQYTVDELIVERYADLAVEHDIARKDALRGVLPEAPEFWRGALAILRDLRIVDPACGSGAFLFQAYDTLESRYVEAIRHLGDDNDAEVVRLSADVPKFILGDNLYGVDLSPEAVEITQLALWIRSAAKGQPLQTLAAHVVHGNSLVSDPAVDPNAFNWRERFAGVFDRPGYKGAGGGFDCVIGNPPWERIKLQEKEFFSLPAPFIAAANKKDVRTKRIEDLRTSDPKLYSIYEEAKAETERLSRYYHDCNDYPLTSFGDANTFALFAELATHLLSDAGKIGLLVPSQIVFAKSYSKFFFRNLTEGRLRFFYDFENRLPKEKRYFPDVDSRLKFGILSLGGPRDGHPDADFVFFAHDATDLDIKSRHFSFGADLVASLNPESLTCPILRDPRATKLMSGVYRRIPILKQKGKKTGNPWCVTLKRKFDQDSRSAWFKDAEYWNQQGYELCGNWWRNGDLAAVPLYEAKMVQAYDHRAASVYIEEKNWNRISQTTPTSLVQHADPEFSAVPVYWIENALVDKELDGYRRKFSLAFKKITSATNTRTMIASFIPDCAPIDSLPFAIITDEVEPLLQTCLLANWNCFAFDFIARQKVGANHLQHYHVEQLPVLPPHEYAKPCPWKPKQKLQQWISERVLKLTCTAEDMLPLADACGFKSGSFAAYEGRLNRWDEKERVELMADLDAAYLHLYGLNRDDAEYVLSTFKGIHSSSPLTPKHVSIAQYTLDRFDALRGA
jgi:hypothetical protein